MSGVHKVKIAARLRPRINGEIDDGSVQVVHNSGEASGAGSFISVANPRDPTQVFKFSFSSCYDQSSTQEEIFAQDVEPLIDVVYSGVTVTIFAYGVTSSGKTHTMQGTKSDPGVIPRVVRAMFDKSSHFQKYDISLAISYMEIYKDEVYDLLVTRESAPKLPVRENDVGKVFVANLSCEPITSVEEFDAIYSRATKHRSVGSTNLNHASSRSHAVLTIEVTMVNSAENKTLTGKINLVDLAGSENNKLTGNDPSRMAESSAINKSLSVLGQVVHALNQGASRIPYRNSKLTRILQDALGGSSVGLLICNLAPGVKFRQDTLNTLNFAVRTKNVENKPVINERENRIASKPHFAAIQPPAPKLAPAILQPISGSGTSSGFTAGPSRPRASLAPKSRVPRPSNLGGASNPFQPFNMPNSSRNSISTTNEKVKEEDRSGSLGIGLTEKEIDERISKAVELEVSRRLAEKEKERAEEEERRAREHAEAEAARLAKSPRRELQTLPSGIITPLLKRPRELDEELKARLNDLERKFERGSKEVQLADVLSPTSKKKTGRAYVALARSHSEKGNLQVALDLYRKAESYVPDNIKLRERIIEIEWAVKNNQAFVPSPKRPKKSKGRKKSKLVKLEEDYASDEQMEVDDPGKAVPLRMGGSETTNDDIKDMRGAEFGKELTNSDGLSKSKRSMAERDDDGDDALGTPPKKQRRSGRRKVAAVDESGEEWLPPAVPKKKTRAGT